MQKSIRKVLAALSVQLVMSLAATVFASSDPIMPVSDIRGGMGGTLSTVTDSTNDIKSFDVEILGVMQGGKGAMPYILARSEGAFEGTDGGLMQGMSGSPVYIDGKLIGAGSATIKSMNPHTFLITPIEEMLPIWSMPDTKDRNRIKPVDLNGSKDSQPEAPAHDAGILKSPEKKGEEASKDHTARKKESFSAKKMPASSPPGVSRARSLAAPEQSERSLVYAGGFDVHGMDFLKKTLGPLGLSAETIMGSASSLSTDYHAELYPGSAVGAALVFGDFSLLATGTVTAVDGKRILAFGHPFLHRGNVNYFMTDVEILGMVNGATDGMKIVNPVSIIGRVSQDRSAGLGGEIGVFPQVVPILVSVEDKTLGKKRTFSASMAYDEKFVPALSQAIAYAAYGRVTDDAGEGTVNVKFSIRTNAVSGGSFERENMFYAPTDAGQQAFGELNKAVSLICTDVKAESDLFGIRVDVTNEGVRKTASIISAVPDKTVAKPGDTVSFKVTLQPYRAEKVTVDVPFTVPVAQPDGAMHLDVHGGGLVKIEALLAAVQSEAGIDISGGEDKAKTVSDKLKELAESYANNDIVIEPGQGPVLSEKEQKKAIREAIKRQAKNPAGKTEAPPKARLSTGYIVDNAIHVTLSVSEKGREK